LNAHIASGLFDDIALRILRPVAELRTAVADGSATDPVAAQELADRMERYAESVLKSEDAAAGR